MLEVAPRFHQFGVQGGGDGGHELYVVVDRPGSDSMSSVLKSRYDGMFSIVSVFFFGF